MTTITLSTVRFLTENDVYHYTVENRPLQDLSSNDDILRQEIIRFSSLTTPNIGDANTTVPAAGNVTVFYNSPLTSNRTASLNSTDPRDGDKVRIVRTANATGGSTLTAASASGAKPIQVGQWADYEYWGNGLQFWIQTAFGSL